jgi:hypothetical protein
MQQNTLKVDIVDPYPDLLDWIQNRIGRRDLTRTQILVL